MNHFKLPAYVGIILQDKNKVLLVERCNTDWAEHYWNFPGGLVEENETLLSAAIRETKEEVGVIIEPNSFELVHVIHVHAGKTNTKDILGFYFITNTWQGIPINNEPHKHSKMGWFNREKLPLNITDHALLVIDGLKTGKRYNEHGW